METLPLTPAERVAKLIKELEITSYQFGKATGISHQTLSNVLTGKNKPGLDTLQAIASVYPNAAIFLLTGTGEVFPAGRYAQRPAPTDSPAASGPAATVESASINSDRELVRMMTEEDISISDPSGPPYRMLRITRTPEEEMEYLRLELLRERQAHERTRERYETDRNQNHERETKLIALIGGGSFNDASPDAAVTYAAEMRVSYVSPDYQRFTPKAPVPYERRAVGFGTQAQGR